MKRALRGYCQEWYLFIHNRQNQLLLLCFVTIVFLKILTLAQSGNARVGFSAANAANVSSAFSVFRGSSMSFLMRNQLAEMFLSLFSLVSIIFSLSLFGLDKRSETRDMRNLHEGSRFVALTKAAVSLTMFAALCALYIVFNSTLMKLNWRAVLVCMSIYTVIGILLGSTTKSELISLLVAVGFWFLDSNMLSSATITPIQIAIKMLGN